MSCPGDLAGAERIAPNRVAPFCSSWSCQHSLVGGLSRMATVYPYWQTGEHTHYSMGHHIHMSLRPYYFVTEGPGYSLKSVQYTVMDGWTEDRTNFLLHSTIILTVSVKSGDWSPLQFIPQLAYSPRGGEGTRMEGHWWRHRRPEEEDCQQIDGYPWDTTERIQSYGLKVLICSYVQS